MRKQHKYPFGALPYEMIDRVTWEGPTLDGAEDDNGFVPFFDGGCVPNLDDLADPFSAERRRALALLSMAEVHYIAACSYGPFLEPREIYDAIRVDADAFAHGVSRYAADLEEVRRLLAPERDLHFSETIRPFARVRDGVVALGVVALAHALARDWVGGRSFERVIAPYLPWRRLLEATVRPSRPPVVLTIRSAAGATLRADATPATSPAAS